ncbi:hypothetical protein VZT92_018006 [Zoarces viviparus]|uniref:Uncharacterized protein n=1 Tax=Zoarces viviparus TaxID=48416 RepID=A0AAW1ENI0_ZOAVI
MLEFSEGLTDPPFSHQPQLIARSRVQSVAAAGNRDPRRLRKQRESTKKHAVPHPFSHNPLVTSLGNFGGGKAPTTTSAVEHQTWQRVGFKPT